MQFSEQFCQIKAFGNPGCLSSFCSFVLFQFSLGLDNLKYSSVFSQNTNEFIPTSLHDKLADPITMKSSSDCMSAQKRLMDYIAINSLRGKPLQEMRGSLHEAVPIINHNSDVLHNNSSV